MPSAAPGRPQPGLGGAESVPSAHAGGDRWRGAGRLRGRPGRGRAGGRGHGRQRRGAGRRLRAVGLRAVQDPADLGAGVQHAGDGAQPRGALRGDGGAGGAPLRGRPADHHGPGARPGARPVRGHQQAGGGRRGAGGAGAGPGRRAAHRRGAPGRRGRGGAAGGRRHPGRHRVRPPAHGHRAHRRRGHPVQPGRLQAAQGARAPGGRRGRGHRGRVRHRLPALRRPGDLRGQP